MADNNDLAAARALEAGVRRDRAANAFEQRGWGMRAFANTNAVLLVVTCVLSILSDPTLNVRNAEGNPDLFFLGLTERHLRILNWSGMGSWVVSFTLHAFRGNWSKLRGFKQQCHRLICLAIGVTSLFLKWVVPDQINISYCPAVITILVETTYLFINVISAVIDLIITKWDWLVVAIPPLFSEIWTMVRS